MRSLAALTASVFALGLAACATTPPRVEPAMVQKPAFVPHFEAAACEFKDVAADWAQQNHIDCGWLHVAESRGKPDSRVLKLWVAIAHAEKPEKSTDSILYIHGGPGIATVDYFFPFFPQSKTWPAFRGTRDVVYFDQRGSGRSEPTFCAELGPALAAIDKEQPDPPQALERRLAAFSACREKMLASGMDFAAYNSIATVEDAEDLRRALGVSQWNLYGISYGTLVGLQYLRQQPGSVRAAILDSMFPPNSPHATDLITPTAKAYQAMQRACVADAACRARFPAIETRLATAKQRLDAEPLTREGGRINGQAFVDALWTMLVQSSTVTWVPLTIERAAAGDDKLVRRIVALYGGTGTWGDYSHGQAMTVNCYEVNAGASAPSVREAMRRYPHLIGAGEIPDAADRLCAAWQPERAPITHFAPVESDHPVLLYGGEFDPATPPEDAVLATRFLPNSTLVLLAGASHAGMSRDDCTRGIAHAFLKDPAAKPDLGCLAHRPRFEFAYDGLDAFLTSKEKEK